MNNIQIYAFIKSLKKTKGRLTNEKTKHMDKTTNSDSGNVGIVSVGSFKQNEFKSDIINVKNHTTRKSKR